jgi:hypothetical protein
VDWSLAASRFAPGSAGTCSKAIADCERVTFDHAADDGIREGQASPAWRKVATCCA